MGKLQNVGAALLGVSKAAEGMQQTIGNVAALKMKKEEMDMNKKMFEERLSSMKLNNGLMRMEKGLAFKPSLRKSYIKSEAFKKDFSDAFGFAPLENTKVWFQDEEIASLNVSVMSKIRELASTGKTRNDIMPIVEPMIKAAAGGDQVMYATAAKGAEIETSKAIAENIKNKLDTSKSTYYSTGGRGKSTASGWSTALTAKKSIIGTAKSEMDTIEKQMANLRKTASDTDENNNPTQEYSRLQEQYNNAMASYNQAKKEYQSLYDEYSQKTGIGSQNINTGPGGKSPTVERKTKDGRTAIFDAETKKFIGYK